MQRVIRLVHTVHSGKSIILCDSGYLESCSSSRQAAGGEKIDGHSIIANIGSPANFSQHGIGIVLSFVKANSS